MEPKIMLEKTRPDSDKERLRWMKSNISNSQRTFIGWYLLGKGDSLKEELNKQATTHIKNSNTNNT